MCGCDCGGFGSYGGDGGNGGVGGCPGGGEGGGMLGGEPGGFDGLGGYGDNNLLIVSAILLICFSIFEEMSSIFSVSLLIRLHTM